MSSVNVGERIRQLRLGLGLSLRAFAAETGFSPSLISQVEHGHVMPSIGSLERIAMALGVSLSTFFAEPETNSDELVRANARQKLTSTWSPVSIEALRPMKGAGTLEPILIVMAPGGRSGKFPTTHDGREVCPRVKRGGHPDAGGRGAWAQDRRRDHVCVSRPPSAGE